jgi:hypothetical protein
LLRGSVTVATWRRPSWWTTVDRFSVADTFSVTVRISYPVPDSGVRVYVVRLPSVPATDATLPAA